ncbi:MAG: hypothetical protein SOU08_03260 [Anaerococcus sp.]|nr:hypothetical protein [Anaerococcus sp.]MDD7043970.1 hypothetical protein [Peptoniphilaceae bacterium]MDY2918640.1 hypothetical protein [Anaerococcus sp.]
MNFKFILAGILGIILLIFVIWWVITSNSFNRCQVVINESKKNLDIALAKRYDTIRKKQM